MYWSTTLAASLLAAGVNAGIGTLIADGLSRNSPGVERRMEEIAKSVLRARSLEVRQAAQSNGTMIMMGTGPMGSNTIVNPDGSINMTAWDEQANAACNTALSHLPEASNPSGTCICYNLPALDNVTGTFEADLRLYQLSTPTGQFAGIAPQDIQVGLSYKGASASLVTAKTASQKVVVAAGSKPFRRQASVDNLGQDGVNPNLKLLQTYLFVGQIDKAQMVPPLTMARLEALVMPVLSLSAIKKDGQSVTTNVSSNEAAFVTGVFSQSIITSDFNRAMLAVMDEVAALKNGTVAFVMPGVQLLILPVGGIVTSIWLAVGLAAYGVGTFERIRFRDQYRRRVERAGGKM